MACILPLSRRDRANRITIINIVGRVVCDGVHTTVGLPTAAARLCLSGFPRRSLSIPPTTATP